MKHLTFLLIFILSAYTGQSQTKSFIDRPFIEVAGTADTLLTPDEIYIKIILSERDNKDRESIEALEINMVETLKNLGIDTEKDLAASDLVSNFKSYFLKRTDFLKAKEYILKVPDAQLATNVFIDLEEIGISNTSIDRVGHSGIELIKMSMRSRASENARERALAFAKPLNQRIGQAIFISEAGPVSSVSDRLYGMTAGVVARGVAEQTKLPKIEFEKIKVEISVEMKFELEGDASEG